MPTDARVPTGRRAARKQATRTQIRDAGIRLFTERGYEETTVDRIIRAAGVSRQTFFNYYPEKSALLDDVVMVSNDLLDEAAAGLLARPASTAQRLHDFFGRAAADMEGAPDFSRIVITHRASSLEGQWRSRQRLRRLTGAIQMLLSAGVAQGDVRSDVPVRFLAEMAAGMWTMVAVGWADTPGYPLRERAAQLAAYLGEAIHPQRPAHSATA